MRFDNERAMALAEEFDFSRAGGTGGEGRAADLVAEEFTRIGLRVEGRVVLGSRFPRQVLPALGWFGLGLGFTLATFPSGRGSSGLLRLAAAIGGIVGWVLATSPRIGFGHEWPPRMATRNVLAGRAVEAEPAVRVVFETPLDGIDTRRQAVPWWASSATVGALVGFLLFSILGGGMGAGVHDSKGWALPILGLLWVLVLFRSNQVVRASGQPGLRDNRTGLAVLLELARTWPRRADARIDAHFAAVGGQGLGGAGARALARTVRAEWPTKPTLFINFLAPGVGAGLVLASRKHEDLVGSAAADLWVPHRLVRRHHWSTWARPVPPFDNDAVMLIGEGAFARSDRGGPMAVAPEALGRAAQLATEIALRWAKHAAPTAKGSL